MNKYTRLHVISLTSFLFLDQANAACPRLKEADLSFYACPVAGAFNPLAQSSDFGGMVYTRPKDFTPVGILGNVCSSIGRGIKGIFTDTEYPGKESNIKKGNIICRYNLSPDQKNALKTDKDVIRVSAEIKAPKSLIATVCPALALDELNSLRMSTNMSIFGTEWEAMKEDKSFFKSLFNAVKDLPPDHIKGVIDINNSVPFEHTCEYQDLNGSTILKLDGTMTWTVLQR